ncbi:acid phosphatase [Lysobacter auxotrophicus]|uniref:acid phosphatase n=1 Tax=Lysobacter auxotrophicus TaxID=2992573 RepID=A0ABM8DHC7_9GAMM|nr:phosphatase PAP2 family protein [Lysobacter auxotrophicus]BDU18023.1 phosphatase PAP2 family protein [Lysobacter auxotrophicus]
MNKSPGKACPHGTASLARPLIIAATLALSACATQPATQPAASPMLPAATTPAAAEAVPEIRPGVLAGYLGRDLPNSLALLPAPPKDGSAAFKQDQAVSRASQKLRGTARDTQATSDADLAFPHVAGAFACALGVPVSQEDSPRLYQLLRRSMTDAGLATYAAKDHYRRTRPFVFYKEGTCAPKDEAALRDDGSYPSGHTSIGWMWALVLTQVAPDHADALLVRGRSFGESRLVCNAHWQSDILAGRTIASGTFARLQSNATYQADVAAATREVQSLRAGGKAPGVDCAAEAAALAIPIEGVL